MVAIMVMAVPTDFAIGRGLARLAFAAGLLLVAATGQAQTAPPPPPASGVTYDAPPEQAAEPADQAEVASSHSGEHARTSIHPYLEISQVVSSELDSGDTLTYTSVAAGIDGIVQTQRVIVQLSYRYQRLIEWDDNVGDQDMHSGLAAASIQLVPGVLSFDAGAMATRTGGEGRAVGTTVFDPSVEVYSAYAGPTLSTHAGALAINAAYRLGYVAIDDDTPAGAAADYGSAVAHSLTGSIGMAPGSLPVGWTIGAGYARTDNDGEFDSQFEGAYVRGDVVVPIGPTLALTAGIGYEDFEASQLDFARDANGVPVLGPNGRPTSDPTRPRLLTYQLSDMIYDAGIIWRPSSRTELQARAGHRYGGTTVVASLSHQFSPHSGMSVSVYDSMQTFDNATLNNISGLPDDLEAIRDPLTGALTGCFFGAAPGTGQCLNNDLQSIRTTSFRAQGVNLTVTGDRGLLSWGVGVGYTHHRYNQPDDPAFALLGAPEDESYGAFGSLSRQLSRESSLNLNAYASWYDTDQANFRTIFSTGGTLSYNRTFLMDRLQLLAALGLYYNDNGTIDSTVASILLGLRYTF